MQQPLQPSKYSFFTLMIADKLYFQRTQLKGEFNKTYFTDCIDKKQQIKEQSF